MLTRKISLLMTSILLISLPARAEFFLAGVGSFTTSHVIAVTGATNLNNGVGWGVGGLIGSTLGKIFEIEFGFHYLDRGLGSGGLRAGTINAQLLFNAWLLPWLAVGAGGYFHFITATQGGPFAGDGVSPPVNIATNGFGPVVGAEAAIPLVSKLHLIVGAHVMIPLYNSSRMSNSSLSILDTQTFVGLRWGNTREAPKADTTQGQPAAAPGPQEPR